MSPTYTAFTVAPSAPSVRRSRRSRPAARTCAIPKIGPTMNERARATSAVEVMMSFVMSFGAYYDYLYDRSKAISKSAKSRSAQPCQPGTACLAFRKSAKRSASTTCHAKLSLETGRRRKKDDIFSRNILQLETTLFGINQHFTLAGNTAQPHHS